MSDTNQIKKLKSLASSVTLLYVEDNAGLQQKASTFFQKFFLKVYVASNGKEGLELFKKHQPNIVVTDIQMPDMNGLEMAQMIRDINLETKIIITTAHDDSEFLHKSIQIGISDYLVKPLQIEHLSDVFIHVIEKCLLEKKRHILNGYMHNIFNSQKDLLILLEKDNVVLANDTTLKFFGYNTLKSFQESFFDFGDFLQPHEGFLFNQKSATWLEQIQVSPKKLHHVKIISNDNVISHFILKRSELKDEKDMSILSLQDITELNLLGLFDTKPLKNDEAIEDKKNLIKLLQVALDQNAELKMHNFYKGLSITNSGMVAEIYEGSVVFRTNFLQQKAIEFEHKCVIESELFPKDLECSVIKNNDLQQQTFLAKEMHFLPTSPTMRESIRVQPEEEHSISLFYETRKFDTDISILDLSLQALRIKMALLPAGFNNEAQLRVDFILSINKHQKDIYNAEVTLLHVKEFKRHFEIVLLFKNNTELTQRLINYISKRQMALVREFKGFQFAK